MKDVNHGTAGGYSNRKCRCDECRTAWNAYQSRYRAKQRDEAWHEKNNSRSKGIRKLRRENQRPPAGSPCQLCSKVPPRGLLHLDHDHITNEFRGWLCPSCNTGLGKLGDSLEGVMRAVRYLSR